MNPVDKIELRRELRRRRRELSAAMREHAPGAALAHIRSRNLWRLGRRWAFYLPFGSEFDCTPLLLAARQRRKDVFLPVTARVNPGKLVFVRADHAGIWRRSRLGMLEPVSRRFVSARRLDVVCMPLLGFDRHGGRLGQGGGFYDRTFAFRRSGPHRPLLIGIAFACQEVERIPMEPWDVRLDWVVTEQGVIACKEA